MNQILATATILAPADIWGVFTRLLVLVSIVTFAALARRSSASPGVAGSGRCRSCCARSPAISRGREEVLP